MKYIFFLESLVSMKMFDTEQQVYLNRWFFFIEIGYENVFELQRGRCAHCLFLYIVRKEHSCLIPSSFHIYCAKHFLPLWFILAWRSFICLRTAFDITSRVLPSMTNATQWILSARLGCFIYPGVSDSKGTKGLNYNIKYVWFKKNKRKCITIAAYHNFE